MAQLCRIPDALWLCGMGAGQRDLLCELVALDIALALDVVGGHQPVQPGVSKEIGLAGIAARYEALKDGNTTRVVITDFS
ncbi:hypothetical protein [Streptomyces sp. NPDC127119]|uniref:hypothetical protein n=1 Tax=Streptomyces sp. NPDC127119 TaxID=3345370 RepID=UPI003630CD05